MLKPTPASFTRDRQTVPSTRFRFHESPKHATCSSSSFHAREVRANQGRRNVGSIPFAASQRYPRKRGIAINMNFMVGTSFIKVTSLPHCLLALAALYVLLLGRFDFFVTIADRKRAQQRSRPRKTEYVQSRSMSFKALKVEKDASDELDALAHFIYEGDHRRNYMYLSSIFQLTHTGTKCFSFNTWFGLLPGSSEEYFGGILLGLQSSAHEDRQWPHYHQQFVMVSSAGELYCSVQSGKHVVANNLEPSRWYHLALTFDHAKQREEVFLDGVKVRSEVGPRHHEWGDLIYAQVGTGCVTSNSLQCPRRGYIGWYGFNGVVDSFRVWRGVLSSAELELLAGGGGPVHRKLLASTRRVTLGLRQLNPRQVKCTRPAEGTAMQLVV
jgi:hypothetical protein